MSWMKMDWKKNTHRPLWKSLNKFVLINFCYADELYLGYARCEMRDVCVFFRSSSFLFSLCSVFRIPNSKRSIRGLDSIDLRHLNPFWTLINLNVLQLINRKRALISSSNKWLLALSSHTSQPHIWMEDTCVCAAWQTEWCRILMKSHGLCEIFFRIWIDKIWQPKNRFIQRDA